MELTDEELYLSHNKIKQMKKNTYDSLYNKCVNKVKLVSKKGFMCCLFVIPKIVFGSEYPKINVKYAADYISDKLVKTNKNIKVTFYEPNALFIEWQIT